MANGSTFFDSPWRPLSIRKRPPKKFQDFVKIDVSVEQRNQKFFLQFSEPFLRGLLGVDRSPRELSKTVGIFARCFI